MLLRPSPFLTAISGVAVASTLLAPGLAHADASETLITIPVSGVHRGAEGAVVSIATVDVPAASVGSVCEVVGQTTNQRSVHLGNDLLITTGGQTFVVPNFEDEGDIVHSAGMSEALGSTIDVAIRFGPDKVSSGGFSVSISCELAPIESTTTTEPAPLPETTVPVEEPVEEIEEPVTTETPPGTNPAGPAVAANPPAIEESPSTTVSKAGTEAPATAPTTNVTATDIVERPQATAAEPTAPVTSQLPVTGASTWWVVGTGLLLSALGLGAVRASTRIAH